MAFFQILGNGNMAIHCDFCFKDVTLLTFIKCDECAWNSCMLCFGAGKETKVHKSTHRYRVISELGNELLFPGWRAIDELLFVSSSASVGIGNIEDLAAFFPSKSKDELEQHFHDLLGIPGAIVPEQRDGRASKSDPNDPVLLSYMPLRQDFESEVFNDYENTIVGIEFNDEDLPVVKRFKEHMLAHYKTVLLQRRMWKNYILDRNLIDVHRIKKIDQSELGTITTKYRWLAQYLSKRDLNKFINGIIDEMQAGGAGGLQGYAPLVDEARLDDVEKILGEKEKELCMRLCMSYSIYSHLKRLAIECYINKNSYKRLLHNIFDTTEEKRIDILYRWFKSQLLIHPNEESNF